MSHCRCDLHEPDGRAIVNVVGDKAPSVYQNLILKDELLSGYGDAELIHDFQFDVTDHEFVEMLHVFELQGPNFSIQALDVKRCFA